MRGVRREDSQEPAKRHSLRHAVRAVRRTAGTTVLKQAVPFSRYLVFFLPWPWCVCGSIWRRRAWMFARLGMPDHDVKPWWLWTGVFGFQTSLNEGALFGMGQGLWPLFAALSLGAAVGILVWLFAAGAARDWLLTVALALVTAGILRQSLRPAGPAGPRLARPLSPPSARRTGPRRPRFHPRDDRPMALAHLQSGRQLPGLRRLALGLARFVQQGRRGNEERRTARRRSSFVGGPHRWQILS